VPVQGAVVTRDDLSPGRSGIGGERSERDGGATTGIASYRSGFAIAQPCAVSLFLEAFPTTTIVSLEAKDGLGDHILVLCPRCLSIHVIPSWTRCHCPESVHGGCAVT
jgi:hypothetical protein